MCEVQLVQEVHKYFIENDRLLMLDCIQQTVNNESTSSTVLVRYLEIIDEKKSI